MTDKFKDLSLETLKASLEEKKRQIEYGYPDVDARALYNDLKALQYEISMRGAFADPHRAGESERTPA